MSRPVLIALAGSLVLLVGGATRNSETLDPAAGVRSPLSEVELLALEQENGCVDESAGAATWPPNWSAATIAGGDVPPRGVIKGPASGLVWPAGVAINAASHEVFAIDSVSNALSMFTMPELFFKPPTSTASASR